MLDHKGIMQHVRCAVLKWLIHAVLERRSELPSAAVAHSNPAQIRRAPERPPCNFFRAAPARSSRTCAALRVSGASSAVVSHRHPWPHALLCRCMRGCRIVDFIHKTSTADYLTNGERPDPECDPNPYTQPMRRPGLCPCAIM